MQSLRELLHSLSLPAPAAGPAVPYALPSAHLLAGELPEGHLHVWSSPPGAGKTALLLGLALDAASRRRPVLIATYDLPAQTLALRLLAMESGVPIAALDGAAPDASVLARAARARARLQDLPLFLLEARGLTVASLEDRLVRSTVRIDVLGVDFAEAVVRPPEVPLSATYSALAALAQRRWISVVALARTVPAGRATPEPVAAADRVGWIEPAPGTACCEATLIANRHGPRHACRLRFDGPTARWVQEAP